MTNIQLIDICVDMDKKNKYDALMPQHGMTLADLLDQAIDAFLMGNETKPRLNSYREEGKKGSIKTSDVLSHYFCYNYSTGVDYDTKGLTEKGRLYMQFASLHDIIKDLVIQELIDEVEWRWTSGGKIGTREWRLKDVV